MAITREQFPTTPIESNLLVGSPLRGLGETVDPTSLLQLPTFRYSGGGAPEKTRMSLATTAILFYSAPLFSTFLANFSRNLQRNKLLE